MAISAIGPPRHPKTGRPSDGAFLVAQHEKRVAETIKKVRAARAEAVARVAANGIVVGVRVRAVYKHAQVEGAVVVIERGGQRIVVELNSGRRLTFGPGVLEVVR